MAYTYCLQCYDYDCHISARDDMSDLDVISNQ